MNPAARKSLELLLAELLDVPVAEIDDETGRDSRGEWTSLAHILIINAVEANYQVTFTAREVYESTTVGLLRAALRAKGVLL